MESHTFTIHEDNRRYALVNYEEIIAYYELPFYRQWFKKCPQKVLIRIDDEVNN